MKQFIPQKIYYEPAVINYELGAQLIDRYSKIGIDMCQIKSHNNIEELRKQPNSSFPKLKKLLIIGTRKTHKYVENKKVSDFLVPFTSSGCSASCTYCYLVCNYNKCSYLRLFVNREEMMDKLIKKAQSFDDDKVFEIGSNSDLILENQITNNLPWILDTFTSQPKGMLTFPTKFDAVEPILGFSRPERVIPRMSLNPQKIITQAEFGTSGLVDRITAINKLCESGYKTGILIAPVIMTDDWKTLYSELLAQMNQLLSPIAKKTVFFEVIFMTYSYIHDKINSEAFPNAKSVFNKELMTGRGRGKYWYKEQLRIDGTKFMTEELKKYFPDNKLLYIV